MSSYQYQDPSPLEKITIRKTAGGGVRAYLFARDGLDVSGVDTLKKTLEEKKMACVATEQEGRSCLEVRGCKDIATLEKLLQPAGLVKGAAVADHSDEEKFSLKDKVKNNMVALYGAINIVADFGLIAYGRMKRKLASDATHITGQGKSAWEEEASGYAYSAGSVMFTLFGRGDKSDIHSKDIAIALKAELQGRGIELPDDAAASSFAAAKRRQSSFSQFKEKLSKGGSNAGNIATGTAGGLILLGAVNNPSGHKGLARFGEGALGTTTALSGYGAALVKEKEPDREHPPTTALGKVKEWIQERPNRLAGYGYAVSTAFHGAEAVNGIKKAEINHPGKAAYARKAYAFRGMFAGLNLAGEMMLAAAPKGHGGGVQSNASIENTALSIVADAIIRQPEEKRDALVKDLSHNFLATPNILGGDGAILEERLQERVQKLESNPWLIKRGGSVAHSPAEVSGNETTTQTKWAETVAPKNELAKKKPEDFISAVEASRAEQPSLSH